MVLENPKVNGYELLGEFRMAGGGHSRWVFARKGTNEYFLKQFLTPTYPVPGSPGSEATKQRKLKECQKFESFQQEVMKKLRPLVADGGNLVATTEFFRDGTKYYTAALDSDSISHLAIEGRLLILRTIAHSLRILHDQNLVHGDIKPANILIKQTATGHFTTKLIDFDNCFVTGAPPANREEMVGDLAYYSPEMAKYVRKDTDILTSDLGPQSDIFALGLVYWEFLTGDLPGFDRTRYPYAWMASTDGSDFRLAPAEGFPLPLSEMVEQMLSSDAADRPTIRAVVNILRDRTLASPPAIEDSSAESLVKLRGSLSIRTTCSSRTTPSGSTETPLRGDLIHKKEK